jgi:gamma-glutamyltranspeptidase/glutathione hydrolase
LPINTGYTAPPPFSGITLTQFLKLSEKIKVPNSQEDLPSFIKKLSAIKNVTYRDRYNNIGDPNFYDEQYDYLVTDQHIEELYSKIEEKNNDIIQEEEHESTTHFVVVDKDGMVVTCTNTISNFFGSRVYVGGFFMNSTLSTSSYDSNSINSYESGKRPRTFTSPTVIIKGNEFIMGIGSAGGERIPQVLTEVLLNYFKSGENIQDSINHFRVVINNNDTIVTEQQLSESDEINLENYGYNIQVNIDKFFYGSVQSLILNKKENKLDGGADPRRHGVFKIN